VSVAAQRSDSIGRNAFFALASQVATASFTAVITVFLVRALDPAGYGVFVLALSVAALLAWPADFGVTMSAARFIAERRGDPAAIAGVLVQALRLKLVLISLMALLLVALAGPIASLYGQPALVWPLRAVAIALFAQNLLFLFSNTFVAVGRLQWQFSLYVSEAAIEATATIVLVLLAGGATAAAFGRAIGYCFGALIGALFVFRFLGRRSVAERRGAPRLRQLASYAGTMMIIEGTWSIFSSLDVLLVGALLGASAAGIYAAPLKLAVLVHYPGLAMANAIAPRLAHHPDHPPDTASLALGLRHLIMLQTAIAVTFAVWAEPITNLVLGSDFADSADVLRALTPAVLLWGIGPLVSVSVNYLGEARRRVPIVVGCLLLHLSLLLVLVNEFGVVGAAISFDISYAVYVGAHVWICARLVGLPLRPLAATAVRSLPAAAAMAGTLLAFGSQSLSLLEWSVGSASGLVAFMTLLVATRALSIAELREILTAISRGLRRGERPEQWS
jgi:O-antigen/teichoic acid export membrane protein